MQYKSGSVNNMVSKHNYLLYRFSITIYLHLASFMGQYTFEKIIEFDLRGPGPLVVHILPQLVMFMTKRKFLRNIFEWIILLFTAKILQDAM